MPSSEDKKFHAFSQWAYFTPSLRGANRKYFHKPSKFCFFGDKKLPKQQNYHKNWHFYDIKKSLCPPCATVDLFLEDFGFRIWIKPWHLILSLLNNNHTRKESSDADTFLLVSHTKALEREKENQLFRHQFLIIDPFLLGILILFNYESTSSILTLLDMGGLPHVK